MVTTIVHVQHLSMLYITQVQYALGSRIRQTRKLTRLKVFGHSITVELFGIADAMNSAKRRCCHASKTRFGASAFSCRVAYVRRGVA